MSLAEDFFRLFAGLTRSYGRYVVPSGAKPNGEGKLHDTTWASTRHGTVTVELWEKHLKGTEGLGIVPIRDDATCVFGAIDVDPHDDKGNYVPMDLEALAAYVRTLELPVVVCRTKSGGAHVYLFMAEPAPAELVRGKLMEWSVALGYPGAEIFPKQVRLASEKDDGSWINIPYCGGKRSTRYALDAAGKALSPEDFVKAADAAALTVDELEDYELPEDEATEAFPGGPPCLQTLARKGFGNWQNNGLFNVAVYLKKVHGEGWEDYLQAYNEKYMVPPVPPRDLGNMVKSLNKKEYSFKCKDEPICAVCNRSVCLTREFGVGGTNDDPGAELGQLLKIETDPPTYIWDVDAARIELSAEDLMDQRRFHKLVVEKLNKWPNMVKPFVWQELIRDRLANVQVVHVPEDATREGQFWVHVQRFCTSKVKARNWDELLLSKPYTEEGRTYFCAADLFQYLTQHRFTGVTEKDCYRWMRKKGVQHHQRMLKGKFLNFWSVPAFDEQTEEHAVPRSPAPERF